MSRQEIAPTCIIKDLDESESYKPRPNFNGLRGKLQTLPAVGAIDKHAAPVGDGMAERAMHRIAGFHFTCGECGHRGFQEVLEQPSIEAIADVRRRARCGQCGSAGTVEILRDAGWTGDMVEKFREHLTAVNDQLCPKRVASGPITRELRR